MASLQQFMIIGNLGKDPEVTTFESGSKKVTFSIAYDKPNGKNEKGEYQYKSLWYEVECWGNLAERASKLTKGTNVYVAGRMIYEEWERDGKKGRKWFVDASQIITLSRPQTTEPVQVTTQQERAVQTQNQPQITDLFGQGGKDMYEQDEELPF